VAFAETDGGALLPVERAAFFPDAFDVGCASGQAVENGGEHGADGTAAGFGVARIGHLAEGVVQGFGGTGLAEDCDEAVATALRIVFPGTLPEDVAGGTAGFEIVLLVENGGHRKVFGRIARNVDTETRAHGSPEIAVLLDFTRLHRQARSAE